LIGINNIEGLKFEDVTNRDNLSYKAFRKKLSPIYHRVWFDIFLGYILLVTTIWSFAYVETQKLSIVLTAILALAFSLIAAFWLAYIQLFIHEAAHYNIHPNKKKNDFMANLFIGLIVGVDIKAYRKTHWKHHLRLGHTDDTEHSYFQKPTLFYIFKMLTGLHVLSVLKTRQKIENAQTTESIRLQKKSLVLGAIFNLIIVLTFSLNELYFTALVWIAMIGVFFPFFATIRQILEHRSDNIKGDLDFRKVDHGKVSRLFKENLFSRFFGGAGFNRHLLHHWDPQISYTRLKEVEEFLEDTEIYGTHIKSSRTTYLKTFRKLIR